MLLTPRTIRMGTALVAAAASTALLAASAPPPAVPLGIGDRLFPHLGNPGYDVESYDIALTYHGDNKKPLDAVTKIEATATAPLSR